MEEISTAEFFKALYGEIREGEHVELRFKDAQKTKPHMFTDLEKAADAAIALAPDAEVYFGVALRDGKGGKKENVVRIPCAWADLDAREDMITPLARLRSTPLPVSAVVYSGTGLHCYWFLDGHLGKEGIPAIERLNKAIAARLGGDSVHDAARVLRAPDTLNWKYGEPKEVHLMGMNPNRRYAIEHMCGAFGCGSALAAPFDAAQDAGYGYSQGAGCGHSQDAGGGQVRDAGLVGPQAPAVNSTLSTVHSPCLALPCRVAVWKGVSEGARNAACFQLALDLKRDGMPSSAAVSALHEWNRRNHPPLSEQEVRETVASVFSNVYTGMGCENRPFADHCDAECRVKRKQRGAGGVGSTLAAPFDAAQDAGYGYSQVAGECRGVAAPQLPTPISPPPLLSLVTIADIVGHAAGEVEFVVEGLAPANGVTMVSGEGGIGKSFVVLDLACAVAEGGAFLGRFECKQGPVLMVDLENHESTLGARARKVAAGRECKLGELPVYFVDKNNLAYAELQVDSPQGLDALKGAIDRCRPRVLVIDPLVAIHGQDENNNVAMRHVMMQLEGLARERELAVIVVHHHRKRGLVNDSGQMMRGASDLRNAVVSHIALKRLGRGRIAVEHDKCRPAEPVESFIIELADNEERDRTFVRYVGEMESNCDSRAEEVRQLIIDTLAELGTCRKRDIVNRALAAGLGVRTLERALSSLLSASEIEKPERGLYALTRAESYPDL